jgi:hypothetical protein
MVQIDGPVSTPAWGTIKGRLRIPGALKAEAVEVFDKRGEPSVLLLAFLYLVALDAPGAALAQAGSKTESKPEESIVWSETEPLIITEPGAPPSEAPRAPPSEAPRLDLSELEQAQLNVESSRLWLVVTSGAFALGWVMTFAGFARCETVNDELICPQASDRTAAAGVLSLSFGSVGVFVSSIMLGVRNAKKKALVHEAAQRLRGPEREVFRIHQFEDARDRSLRARNGLIGSSAAFAVGWIFVGVAIPRCARNDGGLSCTSAGSVHMTIGLGCTASGAAGMLISGILLGVRNAKARDIKTTLPWRRNARLRWDPRSGAFVF